MVKCGDCKYFVRDGKCRFLDTPEGRDKSRPFSHAPFWVWSDCYSDKEQVRGSDLLARVGKGSLQPSLAGVDPEALDSATAHGAWRIVARSAWIWLAVIALLVLAGEAA
jgi:hypothetical protein